MINLFKQLRFFLVVAALISVFSSGAFAEETYNFNGDPNEFIAISGTSVVDTATDKPVAVSCHDCDIAARTAVPLNGLFEPRGSGAQGSDTGSGADTKQ